MIPPDPVQALLDRDAIRDAILRYARAVDRNDWSGVRAAYHPGAHDDHGGYKGDVDGFIAYLERAFLPDQNGTHFIGNCLIELAGPDLALAETYFISERLSDDATSDKQQVRLSWGRYLDRFEKRGGEWRVSRRIVVMDASFTAAFACIRSAASTCGSRTPDDPLVAMRAYIFGLVP